MGAMAAAPTEPERAHSRRGGVRARILHAGGALFYSGGVRAVSADKVIAAAGVSKVTFYRHFPTKDDLVVAYLEAVAERERALLDELRRAHAGDPDAALAALAAVLGELAAGPRFRGCSFVNAGAELADADHPARAVVARHRASYAGFFAGVARGAGAPEPDAAAAELMMVRDGAMVCGDMGDATAVGPRLAGAFAAVLAAHRRAAGGPGGVTSGRTGVT
ncbi:hypothetical protein GCM10009809_32900 [Isoptericola hypogeus]|uniref:HTH tetR-type domain-containing protein n=1 Tax=Isoptericola hypogeus TaxID=300179 RepID=A0ABN2JPZ0_9MICO